MTRPYRFLSTIINSSSKTTTSSSSQETQEQISVESNFVVIFTALLCALMCIVGLIVVARCAWLRRKSLADTAPRGPSGNKGIKKKIVDALPKYAYDSNKLESGGRLSLPECAICLCEYNEGDEIRVLPQCGHGFHVECIDKWLGSHCSCPSCRRILVMTRCKKCGELPAGKVEVITSGEGSNNVPQLPL